MSINSPVLFSFSYAVNDKNCAKEQLLVPDMFEEKDDKLTVVFSLCTICEV